MSDSSVVIPFEGGLDMVTPVQASAPGSLVDCLNYEVGPIKGYRRIDGYERFDGSPGGGIANVYTVQFRPLNPGFTMQAGDLILFRGQIIAVIVSVNGLVINYVPAAPGNTLSMGISGYRVRRRSTGVESSAIAETATQDTRDTAADYEEYMAILYAAQAQLRADVRDAPNSIAGVYYGRDEAFAVVDLSVLNMLFASATLSVGQYIRVVTNSYRVVAVEDNLAYLELINRDIGTVSNVQVVTRQTAMSGSGASLSTITGATFVSDAEFKKYAQPYTVDGSNPNFLNQPYQPIRGSFAVQFDNGTAAFADVVRLTDGVNYGEYDVIGYYINEGGFGTSDAAGVLYLADTGISSTNYTGTTATDVATTAGSAIADIIAVQPVLWAGTAALRDLTTKDAQTFYQWGTYNFKATAGSHMVFTTNGASRAGWISKNALSGIYYYGNIVTNFDDIESDIPKYLAFHAGQRLALGFANGSVQLSVIAQPLNFSGLEGAIEIGNGDNITGLLEATGDSTLVFGPRTIRRLIGEGTNLALRTVSPSSGAMDYTAAVVAGVPLYVNHNGLCALDQTSAYGDFKNSAISGPIDPFFTPRIIEEASSIEVGGTVCAFPVRAKNQYRLFLGDGSVVSMSITAAGPQPMISSYRTYNNTLRIPLAYSSSVSDKGHEYILCVWDREKAEADGNTVDLPPTDMIYRLDNGWGFDGVTFEHYMDTAYLFNQDPTFLSIDRAVLYGMGYGAATIRLMAAGVEDDFSQDFDTTVQDISMPRNPDILYKKLERVMGNVDHANWGRAIKLRFKNVIDVGDTAIEPPHILQSVRLFVQTAGIPEN